MNNQTNAEMIMNTLLAHTESPLYRLQHMPIDNDTDYLDAWFRASQYAYLDVDWVKNLIGTDIRIDSFAFHLDLIGLVREHVEQIIADRLSDLGFVPRLEQYLESFEPTERDATRKLILGYLHIFYSGQTGGLSLLNLATTYDIPRPFVFSITASHRLFQDGLMEVEEGRFNKDRPFHHRDLIPSALVYGIFAGIEVGEEELAAAASKPIARRFGLIDAELDAHTELPTTDEEPAEPEGDYSLEEILRELHEPEETDTHNNDEIPADDSLAPFEDDLDYFHSAYLWLNPLSKARQLEADEDPLDQREQERTIDRLKRQAQKQKEISRARLRKSTEIGFVPRLERLAQRIGLTELEKDVLKALVGERVFSNEDNHRSIGSSDPSIRELLYLLVDDQRQRVKEKRIFLKSAPLARTGLIHVDDREDLQKQLLECSVVLDNRLVEYLIGENYKVSDYVDGSHLYRPATSLENVVLPEEDKQLVMDTISGFPAFLRAKEHLQFSEIVQYGNALVALFVGPSGTGKTMLANAIAHDLDKQILLVDPTTMNQSHGYQLPQLFSLVFREARMNEAVLFFDESEELLSNRINEMLLEIEKHEGIVIFATNASFRIDEAMRRRINLIVNFQEPGPALRKDIWSIHLPQKTIQVTDAELETIARTYELNGGLIKNAVFSALAKAVRRDTTGPPRISLEDLRHGAAEQLRNKLFMSDLEEAKVPHRGLESVVLDDVATETLHEIVGHTKARKVLETEWGFKDVFPDDNGLSILFHGPPGTGKTHAAEALAYEVGKTLKVVNYANILSMWVGGTEKALEALFREVADSESVLLFDEADALFAARGPVNGALDRYANVETDVLLRLIERHNTVAILTTNKRENIDQAFFRRLHYIVEFTRPDEPQRLRLWHKLIPERLPLAADVDWKELAHRFAFTGAEIKATIIGAATKRALQFEGERAVTMADMITAAERVERNQEPGRARTVGF